MRALIDSLLGLMALTGLSGLSLEQLIPSRPELRLGCLLLLGMAIAGYVVTVAQLRRQALHAAVSAFADREMNRQIASETPGGTHSPRQSAPRRILSASGTT